MADFYCPGCGSAWNDLVYIAERGREDITDGTLVYHELTGGEQADRKLTVQQLAEGFSYE